MPKKAPKLPKIPVKASLQKKTLNVSPVLNEMIQQYLAFYEHETGSKPNEQDTIVALLEQRLDTDRDFQSFVKTTKKITKQAEERVSGGSKGPIAALIDGE